MSATDYWWVNNRCWVWSDTHFGHRNITVYQQRPGTHDIIMLDNWVKRVLDSDTIMHLGDLALGGDGNRKRWIRVMKRMPGAKFLILGNHDKEKPIEYINAGFQIIKPFIKDGVAYTHFPISTTNPGPDGDWHTNVHGHIHRNPLYSRDGTPFEGKRYINLSVECTNLAPVQLGNVLNGKTYDTEFFYEEDFDA